MIGNDFLCNRQLKNETPYARFNENILNDRIYKNENNNESKTIDNNTLNRIFGVELESKIKTIKVEDIFRDINKQNINVKKIIDINNNIITNPNKLNNFVNKPNNLLALKMCIYYQFHIKNNFVCSSYGLLLSLSLLYNNIELEQKNEVNKILNIINEIQFSEDLIKLDDIHKNNNIFEINNYITIHKNLLPLHKNFITNVIKLGTINFIDNNNSKNNNISLYNSIKYYSKWKIGFNVQDTYIGPFLNRNIELMCLFGHELLYYENDIYRLVELLYENIDYCMGFIIENKINDIIIPPSPDVLNQYISNLKPTIINIHIPKFTQKTIINPINFLQFIGIKKIFSIGNSSNISEKNIPISLNNIIQNIEITVNEDGGNSENVNTNIKSNINFKCDRPFIYYIRHIKSGTILLIGVFNNY
jgi:hypothetical protein